MGLNAGGAAILTLPQMPGIAASEPISALPPIAGSRIYSLRTCGGLQRDTPNDVSSASLTDRSRSMPALLAGSRKG